MLALLTRFFRSIGRWWKGRRRYEEFTGVVVIDPTIDPSTVLEECNLVLVGTEAKAKWLRFRCPCRCGEILALNLMSSHHPHWTCERHRDGTLTVQPSVDATDCGSHFWIRQNKIHWV